MHTASQHTCCDGSVLLAPGHTQQDPRNQSVTLNCINTTVQTAIKTRMWGRALWCGSLSFQLQHQLPIRALVEAWLFYFSSSSHNAAGKALESGPCACVPAVHREHTCGVPGYLLGSGLPGPVQSNLLQLQLLQPIKERISGRSFSLHLSLPTSLCNSGLSNFLYHQ